MSERDLTKFLWQKHKSVYLRPANAPNFKLMDVMVITPKKGKRPSLVRLGCLFDDVVGSITTSYQDARSLWSVSPLPAPIQLTDLRKELHDFITSSGTGNFRFLETKQLGELWTFGEVSSGGAAADAADIATVGAYASAGRVSTIHNVESDNVNIGVLTKCLMNGGWTVDFDYIKAWCPPRGTEDLELWVVTKLFYHRGIHLRNDAGGQGWLKVPAIVASFGASLLKKREMKIDMGSASQNRIPFAFQAIRLRYNQDGKLTNPDLTMGDVRPVIAAAVLPVWPISNLLPMVLGDRDGTSRPSNHPDFQPELIDHELLDTQTWESLLIE